MSPTRPVTLLTVAERAGVSKTTASDALRSSGRVSAQTRAVVLEAAAELGYVPNGSARHLRRASTGAIGLHVPEVLTRSDYYMRFVFGVVEAAAAHDHDLTLITSGPSSRVPRVDGLILGDPLDGDPVVERLMRAGLPTVTGERFRGDGTADGVVVSDHAAMLGEMLDHLRERGASRPALIVAGGESDWAAGIRRGYDEWCARHGAASVVGTVPFDVSYDETRAVARALLATDPRPDALICAPAGSAAQLQPVLSEAGLRAGTDLLLASCVEGPSMRAADPPITAVDLHPREAGAACAELLFEILNGDAPPGSERSHPIELIVRASTRGATA
ncbi:LacI family DNA-binding transcriptional regulator [Spirillospora sp. NPDC048911]|uniref:LacI family DNA-binding transcriptional regulator n=1 Tax=Spirillospora sp. NPDC048911 TaxID=3364527 RepID=UPI003715641A